MNNINVNQAAAFLSGCDGALIYCHASPDGDTIGSATALVLMLRQMNKKAFAYCIDGIPEKLSFLPTNGIFLENEPEDIENHTLISVDVAAPNMLGKVKNNHFLLSIDHHKVNTVECENILVMSDRIACGEIIFMLLDELGLNLTHDIAVSLYTAICSDSGGFKYDATKPETYRMAARCLELGIDFSEINRRLFESKTKAQIELIRIAYQNLELLCDGKFALVAISPEEFEKCNAVDSDFECITQIPREIKGVLASATIRKKGAITKVSLRSNADIDVASIAQQYGGGGHYHAAGLSFEGDFQDAVEKVRKIFMELSV